MVLPLAVREESDGHPAPSPPWRTVAIAVVTALTCFLLAVLAEALVIREAHPSDVDLDWISDALLSVALGVATYLWLRLKATRLLLVERERAQLVARTQMALAEAMQRRLLPPDQAPTGRLDWAALLSPASGIGGDFYDFYDPEPGRRLFIVADVSGKGIAAAMALTLVRSTFRSAARHTTSPAGLAAWMSNVFYEEWEGSPYVTAVIARLDLEQGALTYTNAGHPSAVRVRRGGMHSMGDGGPPLGVFADARFSEERLEVGAGDVCVFVTDGVSEGVSSAQSWIAPVQALLDQEGRPSARAVCDAVLAAARAGPGPTGAGDWSDDRTVVALMVGPLTEDAG